MTHLCVLCTGVAMPVSEPSALALLAWGVVAMLVLRGRWP